MNTWKSYIRFLMLCVPSPPSWPRQRCVRTPFSTSGSTRSSGEPWWGQLDLEEVRARAATTTRGYRWHLAILDTKCKGIFKNLSAAFNKRLFPTFRQLQTNSRTVLSESTHNADNYQHDERCEDDMIELISNSENQVARLSNVVDNLFWHI